MGVDFQKLRSVIYNLSIINKCDKFGQNWYNLTAS